MQIFINQEIFDKFDIPKKGEIDFTLFSAFCKHINLEDDISLFNNFATDGKLQNKDFRNFFFHMAKNKGRVIYYNIEILI